MSIRIAETGDAPQNLSCFFAGWKLKSGCEVRTQVMASITIDHLCNVKERPRDPLQSGDSLGMDGRIERHVAQFRIRASQPAR